MVSIIFILLCVCAYLLGSVNFAILLCTTLGYPDPRSQGSYNPGATNALRVANKYVALLVLLCDGFKGFLPVYLASLLFQSDYNAAFVGLFAFLGHLYPIFFNFKGGKGVATFIGVLLAVYYPGLVVFILVWLLIALVTRFSSLGAISATIALPIYLFILQKTDIIIPILIIAALLIWRHKDNIIRLKNGEESKIKFK